LTAFRVPDVDVEVEADAELVPSPVIPQFQVSTAQFFPTSDQLVELISKQSFFFSLPGKLKKGSTILDVIMLILTACAICTHLRPILIM
jgi:hypothetical protein